MSQTLTGTNTTDPTLTPQATVPSDGDAASAASVNGALQVILNALGWLRSKCALLNMGGGVITNHGTPSASGDVANKGYVDGRLVASVMWTATVTANPGSVGAQSQYSVAVSVPAAQVGDVILVEQGANSMVVNAWAYGAGQVSLNFNNVSATPSNPGSKTYRLFGLRG